MFFNALTLLTSRTFTRRTTIANPSSHLGLSFRLRSNGPICSIACSKGAILRGSPLNFMSGVNSFDHRVDFINRRTSGIRGACARSHVGYSAMGCSTGGLAMALRGTSGGGLSVIFRLDGGSVTFHCRVPRCNRATYVIVRGRTANFSFPSTAAAFLSPRDSPVVN